MAELRQEDLERLKELLGYHHGAMGPWLIRDLQNHASWLIAAYEERRHVIERLREALGELLTHIRKRGHEDLPHPIWDAVYKAEDALAASPEPPPPEEK